MDLAELVYGRDYKGKIATSVAALVNQAAGQGQSSNKPMPFDIMSFDFQLRTVRQMVAPGSVIVDHDGQGHIGIVAYVDMALYQSVRALVSNPKTPRQIKQRRTTLEAVMVHDNLAGGNHDQGKKQLRLRPASEAFNASTASSRGFNVTFTMPQKLVGKALTPFDVMRAAREPQIAAYTNLAFDPAHDVAEIPNGKVKTDNLQGQVTNCAGYVIKVLEQLGADAPSNLDNVAPKNKSWAGRGASPAISG